MGRPISGINRFPRGEKEKLVAGVFHSVAGNYDIMNDLMSMGIHRVWKRFTIECSAVRPGHKVLDIAGGTGDLSKQFSRLVGDKGRVVLADINESMLKVGRDRLIDDGITGNIEFVQANAECLPFADNTFDWCHHLIWFAKCDGQRCGFTFYVSCTEARWPAADS